MKHHFWWSQPVTLKEDKELTHNFRLLVFQRAVRVLIGEVNKHIASAHVTTVFISEKATKLEEK